MDADGTQQTLGLVAPNESRQTVPFRGDTPPGEEFFSDNFTLECDVFDFEQETLLSVMLPKFILNLGNSVKERSFLLLTFEGSHKPSVYAQILKASKKGIKTFKLHFLSKESNEIESTWSFMDVRIHAVDFGYIARERPDEASMSVEIAYEAIDIDGITF